MRPGAVLAALAVVVALAVAVDVAVPPEPAAAPEPEPQPAPPAGVWYCPATAGPDEPAVLSLAAVGDGASVVVVERYPESAPVPDPPVQLSPGDQLEVPLPPGHAAYPVRVRWRGAPMVASWRVDGELDTASAPCEARPSPVWRVTGLDTAGGSRSTLHLFNAFRVDAVARITFATPEGPVALLLTDNVLVPAGRALQFDLNEVQPEETDLGVTVEVLAGRLVVQGELLLDPPGDQPGDRGRVLLPAADEAGEEWDFAFARADEGATSWLSVMNAGDREAAVEVRVSDPAAEGDALGGEGVGEVSVPPGGVVRVDLAEMSSEPEFGVTVSGVNDVPIVVARLTAIRTGAGRQGVAGALGRPPGTSWALAGAGAGVRQGRLAVYNPGSEEVTVSVTTAGDVPPEWASVRVPPNGRAALSLAETDEERASIGLRLHATGPVVPELRSLNGEGRLRLWSSVGVPEVAWSGLGVRPAVWRDPSLRTRPFVLR